MDLTAFQLKLRIFFKTKYQTILVTPIHKKNSKLEVPNYGPISLLSNIDKIFEKLMHSRLTIEFLEEKQFSISLGSEKISRQTMPF